MLTDLFIKRYPQQLVWYSTHPVWLDQLQAQFAHLFLDLLSRAANREARCRALHDRVARELGILDLSPGGTWEQKCGRFLAQPYSLRNNDHRDIDWFFKSRLSFVELAFRKSEEDLVRWDSADERLGGLLIWGKGRKQRDSESGPSPERESLDSLIEELNTRFREAGLPFRYHQGFIQGVDDSLTSAQIEEPFWALVSDDAWKNVAIDMKEAIDRRDGSGRDSALYATKALESTIKIISDMRGWTTGSERGAANFIKNLAEAKNGAFIADWESELLRALFTKIRNPHGHGPGTSPMPQLTAAQETWVLESAMSWIKSLIRRL